MAEQAVNEAVKVMADLDKVSQVGDSLRDDLHLAVEKLQKMEAKRLGVLERIEELERLRPDYMAVAEAIKAGSIDPNNVFVRPVVERTMAIVAILLEAQSLPADAVVSGMVELTAHVARTVSLIDRSRAMADVDCVTESVDRVRLHCISSVRTALTTELTKIGWISDSFTKPLGWHAVTTCFEWLLTLEGDTSLHQALLPFVEPFRKRFAFHFLDSAETSKPQQFRECVKWTLGVLAARADFLAQKVGHGSLAMFVSEMSALLSFRAKRDIVALLSKSDIPDNATFLDLVDELFSWSAIVEQHYAYSLDDLSLRHALLDSVFPSEKSPVAAHWLALEQAAMQEEPLASMLETLHVRTRLRLAILPEAWQRRKYFRAVHATGLRRLLDTEYEVSRLSELVSVLQEWTVRPEFDQDENLLSDLADSGKLRLQEQLSRLKENARSDFIESLGPWFSKNWLYVTQSASLALQNATDSRLDLSAEICEPFEILRDTLRGAERLLNSSLFTELCLELAADLDNDLVRLLISEYNPPMSVELSKQFAFDANMIFGLWSPLNVKPAALFRRFHECLLVLEFDANQISAASAIHRLAEQDQRLVLKERFHLNNLTGMEVHVLCEMRRDVD